MSNSPAEARQRPVLFHAPREGVAADEALLSSPGEHWWLPSSTAVVVGLGQRSKLASIVDLERARRAGVEVLDRRAGGGALLLDTGMLCGAVSRPTSTLPNDVTESYRWLGDRLCLMLRSLGISARRVEVDEARANVHELRSAEDAVSRILLNACYGALSPHEIAVGEAKLVGLAQIRRRDTSLFVVGILLRDQSPLADVLRVDDATTREAVRDALRRRTVGLTSLTSRSASEVAAAIADATPYA